MKLDEFNTFIQPQRHPKLTDLCTNLTSITQHDVDHAPYYPEAISAFHNVPYPIPALHLNIKKQFSRIQKVRKRQGMAGAINLRRFLTFKKLIVNYT